MKLKCFRSKIGTMHLESMLKHKTTQFQAPLGPKKLSIEQIITIDWYLGHTASLSRFLFRIVLRTNTIAT